MTLCVCVRCEQGKTLEDLEKEMKDKLKRGELEYKSLEEVRGAWRGVVGLLTPLKQTLTHSLVYTSRRMLPTHDALHEC